MKSKIKTIIETGALQQIPRFFAEFSGIALLVADQNTYPVAGAKVSAILREAGFPFREVIFRRSQALVPDEPALAEIQTELNSNVGLLLAVGSGTITDLTRFASFKAQKPFISIPTAPSMDGYASPVAALTLKGFKVTLNAAPPVAIIAEPAILKQAPPLMIQAGLGDLLGKYTSLADWELGRIIEAEAYSPPIAAMVRDAVDRVAQSFKNDVSLEKRITDLISALIISGEAMLAWGNSRPASGGEHHLAHYWEMQAALKGRTGHLHGIKVGIATLIVSSYYHRLFKLTLPEVEQYISIYRSEPEIDYQNRFQTVFGPLAAPIRSDLQGYYQDPLLRQKRQTKIRANWPFLKEWVREKIPAPNEIKSILKLAGAPFSPRAIGINAADLELALQNAKEVRNRYTVFRLAEDLDWKLSR